MNQIGIINTMEETNQTESKYVILHHVTLAATSMIVLIRKSLADRVSSIRDSCLALGLLGKVANKGAVSISFEIDKRRLLFVNCHLESVIEKRQCRQEQWQTIYQKMICKRKEEKKEEYI